MKGLVFPSFVILLLFVWPRSGATDPAICGILESMGGAVEVMDPEKNQLSGIKQGMALPCGFWLSTQRGWAKARTRDGRVLTMGWNTLVEFKAIEDHLALYRGEVLVESRDAATEYRMITANARVRIRQGRTIVVFDANQGGTQLVSLSGKAKIENRFQAFHAVNVTKGRSSSLDFALMRVVPSDPKPVSIASLKGKLSQFELRDYEIAELLRGLGKSSPTEASGPIRALASTPRKGRYDRALEKEDQDLLQKYWMNRMVAGDADGGKILFPERTSGKARKKFRLDVVDKTGLAGRAERFRQTEEKEKKELIEDLSRIRVQE